MYELDSVEPGTTVAPGTNVLITGPPMTGKRRVALDVLAEGAAAGEGSIIVSTKDGAEKILSEFGERVSGDDVHVGVVDCVSKQQGVSNLTDDRRVKYASSPVDMTKIGVNLSEFIEEFHETRGIENNRILLHSVSTILMYSDLQTVFRFLHVFTGRVQSAEALGMYVIDSTAHDDQTMNTLKQLFDAVVEVDADDDGETTVTTRGLTPAE
jgi:KaiC/GvpD/RAD55 family RecA-like ATPase